MRSGFSFIWVLVYTAMLGFTCIANAKTEERACDEYDLVQDIANGMEPESDKVKSEIAQIDSKNEARKIVKCLKLEISQYAGDKDRLFYAWGRWSSAIRTRNALEEKWKLNVLDQVELYGQMLEFRCAHDAAPLVVRLDKYQELAKNYGVSIDPKVTTVPGRIDALDNAAAAFMKQHGQEPSPEHDKFASKKIEEKLLSLNREIAEIYHYTERRDHPNLNDIERISATASKINKACGTKIQVNGLPSEAEGINALATAINNENQNLSNPRRGLLGHIVSRDTYGGSSPPVLVVGTSE